MKTSFHFRCMNCIRLNWNYFPKSDSIGWSEVDRPQGVQVWHNNSKQGKHQATNLSTWLSEIKLEQCKAHLDDALLTYFFIIIGALCCPLTEASSPWRPTLILLVRFICASHTDHCHHVHNKLTQIQTTARHILRSCTWYPFSAWETMLDWDSIKQLCDFSSSWLVLCFKLPSVSGIFGWVTGRAAACKKTVPHQLSIMVHFFWKRREKKIRGNQLIEIPRLI